MKFLLTVGVELDDSDPLCMALMDEDARLDHASAADLSEALMDATAFKLLSVKVLGDGAYPFTDG